MVDINTVIKALECCTAMDEQGFPRCEECPYADPDGTCPDIDAMHRHALELLKKQEPKPVKLVKNAYNHEFYYCPRCDRSFYELSFGKPKFCDKCGQEVKWE